MKLIVYFRGDRDRVEGSDITVESINDDIDNGKSVKENSEEILRRIEEFQNNLENLKDQTSLQITGIHEIYCIHPDDISYVKIVGWKDFMTELSVLAEGR